MTTYTELQTQWTNYMHRADLEPQYDFTAGLIIARLGRDLRAQENELSVSLTTVADTGVGLPVGFREMREVTAIENGLARALGYVTPVAFGNIGRASGSPIWYTMKEGKLYSKNAGLVTLVYWSTPEDLVLNENTPTLDAYPDLYLYAGLAELSRFVQDEALAIQFMMYYKNELKEANKAAQIARTGNRPTQRAT